MNQLLARAFFCTVPALLAASIMLLLTQSHEIALIFFIGVFGLGIQVTGDGKGGA